MHKEICLILILSFTCCTSSIQNEKSTTNDQIGRCREYEVPEGSDCYLNGVKEERCDDCGSKEKLYAVKYNVGKASHPWGFELSRIRIPAARAEEFEALVSKYSRVKCSGIIKLPPCSPEAREMDVKIPWPEWARFQR